MGEVRRPLSARDPSDRASPDLTQDNPQVKLDEAMKEGHVFRLDYVNDDFENNLPVVNQHPMQSRLRLHCQGKSKRTRPSQL